MGSVREKRLSSEPRGILKNLVTPVESRRPAEVDLSGRHLERLPTSLFSSLHLTTINLSHNLLSPTPITVGIRASIRKRQVGKARRKRSRKRRPSGSRDNSQSRPRPSGGEGTSTCKGRESNLGEEAPDTSGGDSGVPADPPVDDVPQKADPQVSGKESDSSNSDKTKLKSQTPKVAQPKKGQIWQNLAEELQAKLKLRRAITEGTSIPEKISESDEPQKPQSPVPQDIKLVIESTKEPSNADVRLELTENTTKKGEDQTAVDDVDTETVERKRVPGSESTSSDESDSEREGSSIVRSTTITPRSLGGIENLKHFQQLQVVVLSQNGLQEFPECLLCLPGLERLDLSHNNLSSLPDAISILTRLVELAVCHNQLVAVGAGAAALPSLTHLNATHNRISTTQHLDTMEHLRHMDLSGNHLKEVPFSAKRSNSKSNLDEIQDSFVYDFEGEEEEEVGGGGGAGGAGIGGGLIVGENFEERGEPEGEPLVLNLRLNNLTGPVTLASIQNVTELDVSDNGISSLDVSCLTCLTSLVCSNNTITTITLHGATLTSLTADNNKLSKLDVRYHPRRLVKLSLSRNQLSAVPPWLVSSTEATLVDVSYNQLSNLPAFLTSGHLRRLHTLAAHHNKLTAFAVPQHSPAVHSSNGSSPSFTHYGSGNSPYRSTNSSKPVSQRNSQGSASTQHSTHNNSLHEEPRLCSLEVLLLHHNKLTSLPSNLFSWLNRLRVLNISANQMKTLPTMTDGRGGWENSLDEGVGASQATLSLQEFYAAANNLRDLTPLQHCRGLRILHAPYNRISSLQDRLVWSWELLEELVLSGNRLTSVPSGVSRLRRLRMLKVHSNPLRSLPRLAHLSVLKVVDASHCQLGRVELEEVVSPGLVALDISANTALSLDHHQFTKCKSRRPVSVVDVTSRFGRSLPLTRPKAVSQNGDSGGLNGGCQDASSKLPWTLGFAESIGRDSRMTVGQLRVPDVGGLGSVGIAAVADGGEEAGSVSSLLASLPTLLQEERACSHTHTYSLKYALLTALRRLRSQGAILPAAVCAAHLESDPSHPHKYPVLRLCCYGSVSAAVPTTHSKPVVLTSTAPKTQKSGTTKCHEGSRCVLAEAPLIPDPHTTELHLGPNNTAVVIASASFWNVINPEEASDICCEVPEPGLAAKRLLDLAQAYGTRQALSVIVIRLLPPPQEPHYQAPLNSSSQMHCKTLIGDRGRLLNGDSKVHSASDYSKRYVQVRQDDEQNSNRKVQFNRTQAMVKATDKHHDSDNTRKHSHDHSIVKKSIYDTDNRESFGNQSTRADLKNKMKSQLSMSLEELDRSSPSGQSQSDNSEHDSSSSHKNFRTRNQDFDLVAHHKALCKSIEDLYARPHRRKADTDSFSDSSRQTETNHKSNIRKAVTYYHYPRPDPSVTSPQNHLADHLLTMSQIIHPVGVLAPPAGFGDPGSDSEGSDSGLSGVSGDQHVGEKHNSEDDMIDGQEQVSEEQFRSWEYLLARNAKLLFMRELDTLTRSNSRSSHLPTASAPDLLAATAAESESSGHFLRNTVRKSRLGRGTFRLIQNKLSATTSKFSTLQRFRSTNTKNESNFRRFGSLQNLKYYQENRPRPPHYILVQPELGTEMQERSALDSLELETRMNQYWHTGVTNF